MQVQVVPAPAGGGADALVVAGIVAGTAVLMAVLAGVARALRRRGAGGAGAYLEMAFLTLPALAGCLLLPAFGRSLGTTGGQVLLTAVVLSGVHVLLAALEHYLLGTVAAGSFSAAKVPKIFRDTLRWTLLFVALLVVLWQVWGLEFRELSILAGALSVAASFALGPTLGSLVSGIMLTSERPFEIGDWIEVDGRMGRVEQITWRSTRIVTRDFERVVFPNSNLASTRIVNLSRPEPRVGVRFRIGLHYRTPPLNAEDALRRVLRGVPGVLEDPAPSFRIVEFADSAVVWEVRFFVEDPIAMEGVRAEVMRRAWYSLKRADIEIPYPIRNIVSRSEAWDEGQPGEARERARALRDADLLRSVPVFAGLPPESIQRLAAAVREESYLDGEPITVEGETGDRMFIIVRGRVHVLLSTGGRMEQLAALQDGDYFGEMSLLTGAPRSATVAAVGSVEAVSLAATDLAGELREHPEFAQRLADAAAVRRTALDQSHARIRAVRGAKEPPTTSPTILGGIVRFFGLGGAGGGGEAGPPGGAGDGRS